MGKAFNIKTVLESVSDDFYSGKINIHEAARILFEHGFLTYSDNTDGALRYISRYSK